MIKQPTYKRVLPLMLAALLGLGATSAQAAAAATVNLVTGVAKAGDRSLHKGDAINAGETITVGNNSYLSLAFADGGDPAGFMMVPAAVTVDGRLVLLVPAPSQEQWEEGGAWWGE